MESNVVEDDAFHCKISKLGQMKLNDLLQYDHSIEPYVIPYYMYPESERPNRKGGVDTSKISSYDDIPSDIGWWSATKLKLKSWWDMRLYRMDETGTLLRAFLSLFEFMEHVDFIADTILLLRVFMASFVKPLDASPTSLITVRSLFALVALHYLFMQIHYLLRSQFYHTHLKNFSNWVWFNSMRFLYNADSYVDLIHYDKVLTSYSIIARFTEDFPQTVFSLVFVMLNKGDWISWMMMGYFAAQFVCLSVYAIWNYDLENTLNAFTHRATKVMVADEAVTPSDLDDSINVPLKPQTEEEKKRTVVQNWLKENALPTRLMYIYLWVFFLMRCVCNIIISYILFQNSQTRTLLVTSIVLFLWGLIDLPFVFVWFVVWRSVPDIEVDVQVDNVCYQAWLDCKKEDAERKKLADNNARERAKALKQLPAY